MSESMIGQYGGSEDATWQPLDLNQRRVLGVLIEKAKTTPDSYPMTLNSITTACNQKSNRKPQLQLESDDVEVTLDELRELGAVSEIQGDGRVLKYRHKAYQWMGVEKAELAVVAELLLRGEQTVGELRARAARMEPIADQNELKPILASLKEKKLLIELSPPGRGQMVTHGLYPEGQTPDASDFEPVAPPRSSSAPAGQAKDALQAEFDSLREMVMSLQSRVQLLEQRLGDSES